MYTINLETPTKKEKILKVDDLQWEISMLY